MLYVCSLAAGCVYIVSQKYFQKYASATHKALTPVLILQVVSLEVRSNLLEGEGVIVPKDSRAAARSGDKTSELPYMVMLNNTLPNDIRIVSWATVDSSFSARFSCLQRTYKYFFPLGEMNLEVRTFGQ